VAWCRSESRPGTPEIRTPPESAVEPYRETVQVSPRELDGMNGVEHCRKVQRNRAWRVTRKTPKHTRPLKVMSRVRARQRVAVHCKHTPLKNLETTK